jgi:hypothetical protein
VLLAWPNPNPIPVCFADPIGPRDGLHRAENHFTIDEHRELTGDMDQKAVDVRMRVLGYLGVRSGDPKFNLVGRLAVQHQPGVIANAGDAVVNAWWQSFELMQEPTEECGKRIEWRQRVHEM